MCVGCPSTNKERCSILLNGAFDQQSAGHGTDTTVYLKFLTVPFFLENFQYR